MENHTSEKFITMLLYEGLRERNRGGKSLTEYTNEILHAVNKKGGILGGKYNKTTWNFPQIV